jgi:hypothetical protein
VATESRWARVIVVGPVVLVWFLLLLAPSSIGLLTRALIGIVFAVIWPAWRFLRSEGVNR